MSQLDTLQQTLASELFRQHDYAWILFDAMHHEISECFPLVDNNAIVSIPLERADIPPEREPKLVAVHSHQVEHIRRSLEIAMNEQATPTLEEQQGFAIGGWLASTQTGKQLARHLSHCMTQRIPKEGRKYFRWADRRVMEWMWPELDETERGQLLGPITAWWTINRHQILHTHTVKDISPSASLYWNVKAPTQLASSACAPAQALIRMLQSTDELPENYVTPVRNALKAAHTTGVTEAADQILLAGLVLRVHPHVLQHPQVARVIQKRDQMPLMEQLAKIPDPAGWQQIQHDLKKVPQYTAAQITRSA